MNTNDSAQRLRATLQNDPRVREVRALPSAIVVQMTGRDRSGIPTHFEGYRVLWISQVEAYWIG